MADLCAHLASRAGELDEDGPQQAAALLAAVLSYERNWREEFGIQHDHFKLVGQDNFRRYLPIAHVRVRVHPADTAFELFARVCAAHVVGSRVTVSIPPQLGSPALKLLEELIESWAGRDRVRRGERRALGRRDPRPADRSRALRRCGPRAGRGVAGRRRDRRLRGQQSRARGRPAELLWYLHEQSISIDYHRYGNLGIRADEPRAEPL